MYFSSAHCNRLEWIWVVLAPLAVYILASLGEFSERFALATKAYESFQLDELPAVLVALSATLAWLAWRNTQRARSELARRIEVEKMLVEKHEAFSRLSRQATLALEDERRRIAHELHDDLGQTFNAIKIEAVALCRITEGQDAPFARGTRAIIDLTDHGYDNVRRLLACLRPIALDELGLQGALEHALSQWRTRSPSIHFSLKGTDRLPIMDDSTQIAIYRICQECITNAIRHAVPTSIGVSFLYSADEGILMLEVRDDGEGADLGGIRRGMGLLGMQDRAESLGGTLQVHTEPGCGFSVNVRVPIDGDFGDIE